MAKRTLSGRARACANIALAKYWGKSDIPLNLPAVPSLSLTLDKLVTDTRVTFDEQLPADEVFLDETLQTGKASARVVELLDRVRKKAGLAAYARVQSKNNFPTAAGLASSASGFAALAAAANVAAGLPYDEKRVSAWARQSSASAARSVYGGFVELKAGRPGQKSLSARPIAPADHWDVRLLVAITAQGPKKVGSTLGMEHSRETSPLYQAWVEQSTAMFNRVKRGVLRRDLEMVGRAMEQSTFSFHACAMASDPGILYWQPPTIAALHTVRALREDKGIAAYATMDAGPHVKVLCEAKDAARIKRALLATEGVSEVLTARPGPAIRLG